MLSSNFILPLCFSIIALVIASPNPAPSVDELLALSSLTKASKILSLISSLIPLPSSKILISILSLNFRDITDKVVFFSLYFIALSIKLLIALVNLTSSILTKYSSSDILKSYLIYNPYYLIKKIQINQLLF